MEKVTPLSSVELNLDTRNHWPFTKTARLTTQSSAGLAIRSPRKWKSIS